MLAEFRPHPTCILLYCHSAGYRIVDTKNGKCKFAPMSEFNISKVDVKLLTIFCAVIEEGSISRAATRLNLSQPLISHALDRMRLAFKDPLFVRSGRSIKPTERATLIAPEISRIVEQLNNLAEPAEMDLNEIQTRFCLSANDLERQLIAPRILPVMLEEAPRASLRLTGTRTNFIERLRARDFDVVVTPLTPPDLLDFHSATLFEDQFKVYFDPKQLKPEDVRRSYHELDHAVVQFSDTNKGTIDQAIADEGRSRNVRLATPSFDALPSLIRGTKLITTQPSCLRHTVFSDFACIDCPIPMPTIKFHMIWHKTTHLSPRFRWFRTLIRDAIRTHNPA